MVLAGKCALSGFSYFCGARLNGDGSLDSTFDGPNGGCYVRRNPSLNAVGFPEVIAGDLSG